jgi:4-hydroxy-tetrahydrodipicolinate synthase
MSYPFKGTGVALVTPFTTSGEVDYEALRKLVNYVSDGGVEYLVVLGTTGESVTLDKEEKQKIYAFVAEANNGKLPLVYGLGGNDTRAVVNDLKKANFNGYSGILSVSPYYNKPIQEGIFQHYKAISENSPLPIILYNVPGRTSSNMLPETTLRIAEFKNVIAVKEASGNLEQMMKIIKYKPANFELISGDDNLTLPIIASGGVGVISVVANVYPKIFSQMVRAALSGNILTAKDLHYALYDFTNLLFAEGNPGGAKYALQVKQILENNLRLPLVSISKGLQEKIDAEMQKIID